MGREYYFISDLHIGGDAELDICDFEAELVAFVRDLADKAGESGREIELIIVGDAFGLWELTTVSGPEKLDVIAANHSALFEAVKAAGETITITLIPGNHDHELACFPEYKERLANFNVRLIPEEFITRSLAGREIYIEHGNRNDPFNRIEPFGDLHATPLGYHFVRRVVSSFGRFSSRGREGWLRNVQSVQPSELIPHWLLSNWFYRELNPILRWSLFPFLLLIGVSLVGVLAWMLDLIGLTPLNQTANQTGTGTAAFLRDHVFLINALVLALVALFCVPFWFAVRDVIRTFDRYGVRPRRDLPHEKEKVYLEAAREVFEQRPRTAVYVYAHTHLASVRLVGDRAVVNTGTWIKGLTRTRDWIRFLPDIYYSWFELSCFRLTDEDGRIVIDYLPRAKEAPVGLTLLQRMLLLGRRPKVVKVPSRTVV
jgi:UDP-2,3-diacylglucosamine pyrophosphatase LpxH